MPPTLAQTLKRKGIKDQPKRERPLWKGPEVDGVTQSLISKFLCCRERFRLKVVEGLQAKDNFEHQMEYGNLWHVCEKSHAASEDWEAPLKAYSVELCKRYPMARVDVEKYWNICKVQYPIYVKYWAKNPDVKQREPLMQEHVFDVPYKLPSGRILRLKGKFDSVDLIGPKKSAEVYLQENKAKGKIVESNLKRQLSFDLQTGIYLVALRWLMTFLADPPLAVQVKGKPLAGIRYNCIRRPLAGGMHSISKLQNANRGKRGPKGEKLPERPETDTEYYARLGGLIQEEAEAAIAEKRDCHYFMRWKVEVTPRDLERFEQRFLQPIGEQLCDWWEAMGRCDYDPWKNPLAFPDLNTVHWQHPFGVYNSLMEVGFSDLDECIATGSELGLERSTNLFPELS